MTGSGTSGGVWAPSTTTDWLLLPSDPVDGGGVNTVDVGVVRSFSRQTLSKALAKSITIRSVCFPSWMPLSRSCVSSSNWLSQDRALPKPCCFSEVAKVSHEVACCNQTEVRLYFNYTSYGGNEHQDAAETDTNLSATSKASAYDNHALEQHTVMRARLNT